MEQFKTTEDLRDAIKRLSIWFARSVVEGEHPTLHLNPNSTNREVVNGIQRDDYVFSNCGSWIVPSAEHGLSFSGHWRSEEHTSELQSRPHLVCRLLLEKKKT